MEKISITTMNETKTKEPGLLLYAKRSGPTSFNALWDIKKALDTKKIGHTGTLDSFAEGLLVVLSNGATKLVSHVTNFDKKYEAIIAFGQETDTLDPLGTIISESDFPSKEALEKTLENFTGKIEQRPPIYSSIYVQGKRASDLARDGEEVALKKRLVEVYSLELLEVDNPDAIRFAHIRAHVSKGTYIRSLARDIAKSMGLCAHLARLRRTSVGPFSLEDAVFFEQLSPFNLSQLQTPVATIKTNLEKLPWQNIKDACLALGETEAKAMGFSTRILKKSFEKNFSKGMNLEENWFSSPIPEDESLIFSQENQFLGAIKNINQKLSYSFVIKT